MSIFKNHKKNPPLSFLFLYPWSSKRFAVSDCFHSSKTLPLAERMLFTMSMMLGIGYSLYRHHPLCGDSYPELLYKHALWAVYLFTFPLSPNDKMKVP